MEPELTQFETNLNMGAQKLEEELRSVRTNRPNAKLVEDIKVDYYGQMLPIKALGSIGIAPPREITISVWDKNALQPIMKAIQDSGIGMTPNNEGNMIRLNVPTLNDERREELIKLVKRTVKESKIGVRDSRDEVIKKVMEGIVAL